LLCMTIWTICRRSISFGVGSQNYQRNPSTLMSWIVQRFRKPKVSMQLVPSSSLSNNTDASSMWINWHFLRPKKSFTIPIQHLWNHLPQVFKKINNIKDYFASMISERVVEAILGYCIWKTCFFFPQRVRILSLLPLKKIKKNSH
jgi:hypothetical protein